ncbi:MAG: arginase, partial [Polaribacter sp.]
MIQNFLTPVKEQVETHSVLQSSLTLGNKINIYTQQKGFPDLENVQIALFGVQEDRNSENNFGCGENLYFIR